MASKDTEKRLALQDLITVDAHSDPKLPSP